MSKTTTTKTAEELREERLERTRAERIKAIHVEIEKAKTGISTSDLVAATGYSRGTILSTMKLVNRTIGAIAGESHKSDQVMYAFTPKIGWRVAAKWDDRSRWHITLHRHALTRCESLKAEADVAEALWPGGAPAGLSTHYAKAVKALDRAGGAIASLAGAKGKSPKPKPVKRRVRLRG